MPACSANERPAAMPTSAEATASMSPQSEPLASNSALCVRTVDSAAMPAILEMARGALGTAPATPMTPEFWAWKHAANPFGPSYGIYAWDDAAHRVAGLRMFLRWKFAWGDGKSVDAVRAVDTATHADYRRRGLFSQLTQHAIEQLREDGVGFIFNTPNESSLPGYLKLGWQTVASLPLMIRPLRPARMVARRIRPRPAQAIGAWEEHFTRRMLRWAEFIDEYGDAVDTLIRGWEECRVSTGLRTVRDRAYFDWRYGGHPHVAYGVCVLAEPAVRRDLLGFAVVRPNRRYGWQEAVLDELVLVRPDEVLGRKLLAELPDALCSDYLIAHSAEGTFERRLLRKAGFWVAPRQGMLLAAREMAPLTPDLFTTRAWDLTLGDLELF